MLPQKFPDTLVSLEGNTKVRCTACSEPLIPSWSRWEGRLPCFVWCCVSLNCTECEADSCVRTSTKDLTWQVTNKFLSVHREGRQWPKVQKETLKQNKTASFFLPKCLLWAYFHPTSPGHFIGLPSPLYSSHSLGHLRPATDQYEQFLEKYDVSMTTKPQILSGRQWDQ